MGNINALLEALDERTIAKKIGIANDEARMQYQLRSSTVSNFDEFSSIIADWSASQKLYQLK